MNPNDDVASLKSIGPERRKKLNALGIFTVSELLTHFPRDYRDRSVVSNTADVVPGGMFSIKARVSKTPENMFRGKLCRTRATVSDGTGSIELVWFNQPYMSAFFKNGMKAKAEYIFTGEVSARKGGLVMESPDYEAVTGKELLSSGRIVPVYPSTAGLSQKLLRTYIKSALDALEGQITETLPDEVIAEHNLCPRQSAIPNIHFPESDAAFFTARRTLVFSELFHMRLSLLKIKGAIKSRAGIPFNNTDAFEFLLSLPFEMTSAQKRTLNDIFADFSSGHVMNRLLQGDVGSGKTAVAMAAAYVAAKNGFQTAVMAPTETLARQHFKSFSEALGQHGVNVGLLSGSLKKSEKDEIKEQLALGKIQIITGTHALIQENVAFSALGLVICDEQHRFGVRQRGALAKKGADPHVLVMTATPIPRTLALILYGDLDISVIDELPPGRMPIDTRAVTSAYRPRILKFIRKQVEAGGQAYVVCPVIEENELDMKSVSEYSENIRMATGCKTAVLHGKMKQADKNSVMEAFADGETEILVSTTVIEVGVNVPNATVMLVENAERFGLAQLHQLRGRVGRGAEKSYCILVTNSKSDLTKQRMKAMTGTNDGFKLSDLDLTIRGPGEFFGTRQHGLPEMRIANLYGDIGILNEALDAAQNYFDNNLGDLGDLGNFGEIQCVI